VGGMTAPCTRLQVLSIIQPWVGAQSTVACMIHYPNNLSEHNLIVLKIAVKLMNKLHCTGIHKNCMIVYLTLQCINDPQQKNW
jgi:hypothetical protein